MACRDRIRPPTPNKQLTIGVRQVNIFYTSTDPYECAKHLDDKRLNKMLVETAQLLCTAARHYVHEAICNGHHLYKSTHVNHPCAMWIRQDPDNFSFGLGLLRAYVLEYKYRFDKIHKSGDMYFPLWQLKGLMWPSFNWVAWRQQQSEPPHCFHPLVSRDLPATKGYQETLRLKWVNDVREPKWTKRDKPFFAEF